ncbi:hypothetical protein ScPMuIL_011559 [Solemya velum]
MPPHTRGCRLERVVVSSFPVPPEESVPVQGMPPVVVLAVQVGKTTSPIPPYHLPGPLYHHAPLKSTAQLTPLPSWCLSYVEKRQLFIRHVPPEYDNSLAWSIKRQRGDQTYNYKESGQRLLQDSNSYIRLQPTTLFLDYEVAIRNAATQVFPGINIKGCFFHYTQCIWRNAQKHGLQVPYKDNDDIRTLFFILIGGGNKTSHVEACYCKVKKTLDVYNSTMARSLQERELRSYRTLTQSGIVQFEETVERLTVSGYSGNAGDSLRYSNNWPFTTQDRDHDGYSGNCAVSEKGAWWYRNCSYSNLNGSTTTTGSTSPRTMTESTGITGEDTSTRSGPQP